MEGVANIAGAPSQAVVETGPYLTEQSRPGFTVDEEARLISVSLPVVIAGQATFVVTAATMYWFFLPLLGGWQSTTIGAMLAVFTLACLVFDLWLVRGGMAGKRVKAVSRAADLALAVVCSVITMLLVWFALPNAGLSHWIVATAFCVGYVPMQLAAAPDNAVAGKISIVVVLGGFFLYLLTHGWRDHVPLMIMLVVYGAALFYLSDMFLGVVRDSISARRLAEHATAEQRLAVEAVAAERDAKTRFIAAASHDLAQPLQAARLFVDQARTSTDPWQRDEAIRQTQATLKSTQSMLGQLLYHMRLEADEVDPQVQPVRIDQQLRDIAARHAEAAMETGMRIRVRCPVLRLASDPVLLDRAIGNLLHNATVHSGASVLSIVAGETAKGVRIYVIDNGRGVPAEEAETIFADYTQGAGHRDGFGLGLASVVRVAKLLGGSAGLHPRRRGAAFWISLSDGAAKP